ncbi:unnamed protein product [Cuscuta europaea]|uniref:Protein NBR1 homolog n=1 Tax=Cuscuta europaea TaxID=41803 RepID=A0A9P0ZMG4_CUSEU|nr:unnamed protein product [Cuscuta europaea]
MESSIVIKVKRGDTLRRFKAPVVNETLGLNINELKEKILQLFQIPSNTEITLTYTDEDDEEVTLADDDDLTDIVKQELDPLRISVKLNAERNDVPSERPPSTQSSFQAKHFKRGPGLLHEAPIKLFADMVSSASSSAPPVLTELAEAFSRIGSSYLNQLLETQSKKEPDSQRQATGNASGVTENNPSVDRVPSDMVLHTRPDKTASAVNEVLEPSERSLTTGPESEALITKKRMSVNLNEPLVGSTARDPEPTMFEPSVRERVDGNKFCDSSLVGKALGISSSSVPSVVGNHVVNTRGSTGFGSSNPSVSFGYSSGGPSRKTHQYTILQSNPPRQAPAIMDVCPFSGVQTANNPVSPPPVPLYTHPKVSHGHSVGIGKILHKGVCCDGCGVHPITGPRFKSKAKENYDLCSICFCNMGCSEAEYIRIDRPVNIQNPCAMRGLSDQHARMRPPYMYHGIGPKSNRPKLSSRFVQDVNIPDGTIIPPSTRFTKIWRMRNNGNIFWPKGSKVVWIDGDILSDVMSVDLEIAADGVSVEQELDVAVDLIAPNVPGRYVSNWRMASPLCQTFGQLIWVQIQVVATTNEPTRNPAPESLRGLNLNLPPSSSSIINAEMVESSTESIVGDSSHPEPILSYKSVELVEPSLEGTSSMKGQEANFFPINDSLIIGVNSKPQPATTPATASSVSYPVVDLSDVAPAVVPLINVDKENSEVETTLLKELYDMGFKQTDLNKEVLRMNEYDLQQSIDDLCGVSEWDPVLEELEEMGFCDKGVNKKLLKKNGGSIKRVVMDLISREE